MVFSCDSQKFRELNLKNKTKKKLGSNTKTEDKKTKSK